MQMKLSGSSNTVLSNIYKQIDHKYFTAGYIQEFTVRPSQQRITDLTSTCA